MAGRRSVSLPTWVVLGVVLILALALVVPDQAAAIAALGGGLLQQALALSMGCGGGDPDDPGPAEAGHGAPHEGRRGGGGPRPGRRPARGKRADAGYPGAVGGGEEDCDDWADADADAAWDGEGDGGEGVGDDGEGGEGDECGGDARIARQGLSRNDPYRPLVGLTRRKEAIAPYYREDLEEQEQRVWWGNSEQ
jgi:hypothetical protein